LITRADIGWAERFVAGRGVWAIPLGRALPVVRAFVSIVAGLIEVPPVPFGVLSLIGTAVWVTTMSLIGYGVGSAWRSIAHGIAVAGYVIASVVVLTVAAFIASGCAKSGLSVSEPGSKCSGRERFRRGRVA
jgi:membrane protein DedA with SNARE-associated domain